MNRELLEKVKRGTDQGKSSDALRSELVNQGFIDDEVVEAIQEIRGAERTGDEKKNIKIFTFKEVFDRVGYGFASTQFINILFYMIGAGYFVIGLVNGLKTILSIILSSFLQEYSKVKNIGISFISKAGILFGLSFLFMAMSITIKSVPMFAASLLVGAIGVVTYGDLYERLAAQYLKREKLSKFLLNISHFGVIITGLAMILSGVLFDRFPAVGAEKVVLFGKSLPLLGYLICFEITAIALILSGYVLSFVKENVDKTKVPPGFFKEYLSRLGQQNKEFFRSPHLVLLLFASAITGLVQILGNSYYGIFIYEQFRRGAFVGVFPGIFLNIAFIFLFAIVVSFLGPAISNYLNKKVGLAPSMVFGSLLLATTPLVFAYNPHFMPIFAATALGIIGAAILGMGQGLLVRKLLREEQRGLYYAVLGVGVIIPFLVMIPAGAYFASAYGLTFLFKVLALVMVAVAAPIYFALVIISNKQRL
jgi:hypothetical protein